MPSTPTPLRYPGGKTKLYKYMIEIFKSNNLFGSTYIEPFAGGSGLAIKLLFEDKVSDIVLSDLDPLIYSFWYSVLNYSYEMCHRIENIPVTVDEWEKQKYITLNLDKFSILDIGFATFYLNRTNVSGVITGGIIGGKEQRGNYKLDARFNRKTSIQKIIDINMYRDRITIYNKDAKDFIINDIPNFSTDSTFINFDPPYVKKGSLLYRNSFTKNDHIDLQNLICNCKAKWIVTYDKCAFIHNLYHEYKQEVITLNYSTGSTKNGDEIVIYCNDLNIPIC